jgi:hypothetical protein
VGESFVPVIGVHKRSTFIKIRSYLFGLGVYPGVEYRILDINILKNKSNISSASNDISGSSGNSKVRYMYVSICIDVHSYIEKCICVYSFIYIYIYVYIYIHIYTYT